MDIWISICQVKMYLNLLLIEFYSKLARDSPDVYVRCPTKQAAHVHNG